MSDTTVPTQESEEQPKEETLEVKVTEQPAGINTETGIPFKNIIFNQPVASNMVTEAFQGNPDIEVRQAESSKAILSFANNGANIRNTGISQPLEQLEAAEYMSRISNLSVGYVYSNFNDVASALYPNMPANPNKINDAKYIMKKMRVLGRDLDAFYQSFHNGERSTGMQMRLSAYRQQLIDADSLIEALPTGPVKSYMIDKMGVIKEQWGINSPQMVKATLTGVLWGSLVELGGTAMGTLAGIETGPGALISGGSAAAATAPFAISAGKLGQTYSMADQIYDSEAAASFYELYLLNQQSEHPVNENTLEKMAQINGAFKSALEMIDVNTGAEKNVRDTALTILRNPLRKKTYGKLMWDFMKSMMVEEATEITTEELQYLVDYVTDDLYKQIAADPEARSDEDLNIGEQFVTHFKEIAAGFDWKERYKEMVDVAHDTAWGVVGQSGVLGVATSILPRVAQDVYAKRRPLTRKERTTLDTLPDMADDFYAEEKNWRERVSKLGTEKIDKYGALLHDTLKESPMIRHYLTPVQAAVYNEYITRNKEEFQMQEYFSRVTGYTLSQLENATNIIVMESDVKNARVYKAKQMLASVLPYYSSDKDSDTVTLSPDEQITSTVHNARIKITDENDQIHIYAETEIGEKEGKVHYTYDVNEDGSLRIIHIESKNLSDENISDIANKLLKVNLAEESAITMTRDEKEAFDTIVKFKRKKRENLTSDEIKKFKQAIQKVEDLRAKLSSEKFEGERFTKRLQTLQYKARFQYADSAQLRPESVAQYKGEMKYPLVPVSAVYEESMEESELDELLNDFYAMLDIDDQEFKKIVLDTIAEVETYRNITRELERARKEERPKYYKEDGSLNTEQNLRDSVKESKGQSVIEIEDAIEKLKKKLKEERDALATIPDDAKRTERMNQVNSLYEKTIRRYEESILKILKDESTFMPHPDDVTNIDSIVEKMSAIDERFEESLAFMTAVRDSVRNNEEIDVANVNSVAKTRRMDLLLEYFELRNEAVAHREATHQRVLQSIMRGEVENHNPYPYDEIIESLDKRIVSLGSSEDPRLDAGYVPGASLSDEYKAASATNSAFVMHNETILNDLMRLHNEHTTTKPRDLFKSMASVANRFNQRLSQATRDWVGKRELEASDIAQLVEDTRDIVKNDYFTHVTGESPETLRISPEELLDETNQPTPKQIKQKKRVIKKKWPKAIRKKYSSLVKDHKKREKNISIRVHTAQVLNEGLAQEKEFLEAPTNRLTSLDEQLGYIERWFEIPFLIEELHEEILYAAKDIRQQYDSFIQIADELEAINTVYKSKTGYPVYDLSDLNELIMYTALEYNKLISDVPTLIEERPPITFSEVEDALIRKHELLESNKEKERLERQEERLKVFNEKEIEELSTAQQYEAFEAQLLSDTEEQVDYDMQADAIESRLLSEMEKKDQAALETELGDNIEEIDDQELPSVYLEELEPLGMPTYTEITDNLIEKRSVKEERAQRIKSSLTLFHKVLLSNKSEDKTRIANVLKNATKRNAHKARIAFDKNIPPGDKTGAIYRDTLDQRYYTSYLDDLYRIGLIDQGSYTYFLTLLKENSAETIELEDVDMNAVFLDTAENLEDFRLSEEELNAMTLDISEFLPPIEMAPATPRAAQKGIKVEPRSLDRKREDIMKGFYKVLNNMINRSINDYVAATERDAVAKMKQYGVPFDTAYDKEVLTSKSDPREVAKQIMEEAKFNASFEKNPINMYALLLSEAGLVSGFDFSRVLQLLKQIDQVGLTDSEEDQIIRKRMEGAVESFLETSADEVIAYKELDVYWGRYKNKAIKDFSKKREEVLNDFNNVRRFIDLTNKDEDWPTAISNILLDYYNGFQLGLITEEQFNELNTLANDYIKRTQEAANPYTKNFILLDFSNKINQKFFDSVSTLNREQFNEVVRDQDQKYIPIGDIFDTKKVKSLKNYVRPVVKPFKIDKPSAKTVMAAYKDKYTTTRRLLSYFVAHGVMTELDKTRIEDKMQSTYSFFYTKPGSTKYVYSEATPKKKGTQRNDYNKAYKDAVKHFNEIDKLIKDNVIPKKLNELKKKEEVARTKAKSLNKRTVTDETIGRLIDRMDEMNEALKNPDVPDMKEVVKATKAIKDISSEFKREKQQLRWLRSSNANMTLESGREEASIQNEKDAKVLVSRVVSRLREIYKDIEKSGLKYKAVNDEIASKYNRIPFNLDRHQHILDTINKALKEMGVRNISESKLDSSKLYLSHNEIRPEDALVIKKYKSTLKKHDKEKKSQIRFLNTVKDNEEGVVTWKKEKVKATVLPDTYNQIIDTEKITQDPKLTVASVADYLTSGFSKARAIIANRAKSANMPYPTETINRLEKIIDDMYGLLKDDQAGLGQESDFDRKVQGLREATLIEEKLNKLYEDYRYQYNNAVGIQAGDLYIGPVTSYVVSYKGKPVDPYYVKTTELKGLKEEYAKQDQEGKYEILQNIVDKYGPEAEFNADTGVLTYRDYVDTLKARKERDIYKRTNPYLKEYKNLLKDMQKAVDINRSYIARGEQQPIDMTHYKNIVREYQKRLELFGVKYDEVDFGDTMPREKVTDTIRKGKITLPKERKRGYVSRSDTVLPVIPQKDVADAQNFIQLQRKITNALSILRNQSMNIAGTLTSREAEIITSYERQLKSISEQIFAFEQFAEPAKLPIDKDYVQPQLLNQYNRIAKGFNEIFSRKMEGIRAREAELYDEMIMAYELSDEERADIVPWIERIAEMNQKSVELREKLNDIQDKIEGPDNINEVTYEFDENGNKVETGTKNIRVRKNHWRRIRTELVNTELSNIMNFWQDITTKIHELERRGATNTVLAPYREMLSELMNMTYNTMETSEVKFKEVLKMKDSFLTTLLSQVDPSEQSKKKEMIDEYISVIHDVMESISDKNDIYANLDESIRLAKKQRFIKKKVFQQNMNNSVTTFDRIKSIKDSQAMRLDNFLDEAKTYQQAVEEPSEEMIKIIRKLYKSIKLIENREEMINISAKAGLYEEELDPKKGATPQSYTELRLDIEERLLRKLSLKQLSSYYKLLLDIAKRDAMMLNMQLENDVELGYSDLSKQVAAEITTASSNEDPDRERRKFDEIKDRFAATHGYNYLVEKISGVKSLVYKVFFGDLAKGKEKKLRYLNKLNVRYEQNIDRVLGSDRKGYYTEIVTKVGKRKITKDFMLVLKQNRRVADNWNKIKENTLFYEEAGKRAYKFTEQEKQQLLAFVDSYQLSQKDEQVLDVFQDYMNHLYHIVNERYVEIYGKRLPKNNFYIQLFHTTEYSTPGADVMLEANNLERNILSTFAMSMIHERRDTKSPVKLVSFGNYLKQAGESSATFYFMQKEFIRANAVLTSSAVRKAIEGYISPDYYKYLHNGLKRWSGDFKNLTAVDRYILGTARKFLQATIMGNPFIAMMQPISLVMNVFTSPGYLVRAMFDANINKKEVDMILNDNMFYKSRAKEGGNDAMKMMEDVFGGEKFSTGSSKWRRAGTWMTKATDKHTIRIGMWASYNEFMDNVDRGYFKDSIKNLMDIDDRAIEFLRQDPDTKKQVALEYAEATQRRTQPQTDQEYRSELQSDPKLTYITMFGSFVQVMHDLRGRTFQSMLRGDKGSIKVFAQTMVGLYLVMPLLTGLIDVGRGKFFKWTNGEEDDDPFWQLWLDTYLQRVSGGYDFFIRDVVSATFRAIKNDTGVDIGSISPIENVIELGLRTGRAGLKVMAYGASTKEGKDAMWEMLKNFEKLSAYGMGIGYQPLWIMNGILKKLSE